MATKKKRSKKEKNYFNEIHEAAILAYQDCKSKREQQKIYKEILQPVFKEMIRKIVFKFKFTSIPNINSLMDDCESDLATIIYKFDREKNHKAFSYFSVVIRNFFIRNSKKNQKALVRNIPEDIVSNSDHEQYLSTDNEYYKERSYKEFFEALKQEMESWFNILENKNDIRLLEGIFQLWETGEELEDAGYIFGKKAIKQEYLPALTGMTTKEINESKNRLKPKYETFVKNWYKN